MHCLILMTSRWIGIRDSWYEALNRNLRLGIFEALDVWKYELSPYFYETLHSRAHMFNIGIMQILCSGVHMFIKLLNAGYWKLSKIFGLYKFKNWNLQFLTIFFQIYFSKRIFFQLYFPKSKIFVWKNITEKSLYFPKSKIFVWKNITEK